MKTVNIPEKIFLLIMTVCAVAVVSATVQAFYWASDPYILKAAEEGILSGEDTAVLKTGIIMVYFVRVVPFVGFAGNTFLARYKTGISRMFLVIWSMVLLGMLMLQILTFNYRSIVYYILTGSYILLIISLFMLKSRLAGND